MTDTPGQEPYINQEENLLRLFEQAPALIAVLRGREGRVEVFNPLFTKLWGGKRVIGKTMHEAFGELEGQGWLELVEKVLDTGKPIYGDAAPALFDRNNDGIPEESFFNFVYQPYKDKKGKTVGVMIFGVDVTDQVVARKQAAQSEERYQAFIQNSNEGIWRAELDEPIPVSLPIKKQLELIFKHAYMAEANLAMAKMYGFRSTKPLVGLRLSEIMPKDDPENLAYLTAFIQSGYKLSGVDSHEKDHKGRDKYFRNSLVGIVENGKVLRAWGTQQDITEQRSADIALRKSEERLSLALQASQMGLWEWDVPSGELHWSDELKKLFGLKPSDTITFEKYQKLIHPADRSHARTVINHSMETGSAYKFEHRVIWPNGSIHWLLGQGRAFLKDGKAARMIGTCMNIDDRKRAEELKVVNAELKTQAAQLVELNKSKDDFISLASHQLRTPATGVKQYIGMLLEGYGGKLTKNQMQLLRTAYESNERQLTIIDDLLRVAHVDAGKVLLKKEQINLVTLMKDVMREQQNTFRARNQRMVLETGSDRIMANIDPARIRMVLENLLDNASKYSHEDTSITAAVQAETSLIVIEIRDQGVGIAAKDLGKLFQKFSRVHNSLSTLVGGTGIGLYWAKKIIDLHGGTIQVRSRLHKGTTFTIKLPRYEQ